MAKAGGNGLGASVQQARPSFFTRYDAPSEVKLRPPRPRPEWVERRDLLSRLDRAASRLVLLSAPAGYGKTTLLAQWCAGSASSRAFAWVSLDEDDNDPAMLWCLVVSALERAVTSPELASLARLARDQLPAAAGTLLAGLSRELATIGRRVTIVLDGYDAITDRDCHRQLRFLLRRLPPQAQVALGVRGRPALGLARMRTHGEMTELGPGDLRLTSQHVAALVRGLSGADLGWPELARLVERTEGWPAGVYLLALSMCAAPDPRDFMRRYTGGNRYVADFLTEEVINRQPAHIRQFLLRTSVLDRFTVPLCEAVTESAGAGEIIGLLDQESLFLVPLDDHQEWFRYHYLFADVLLRQFSHSDPEAVPGLRLRASAWHRQRGQPGAAIHYAIAAGAPAAAAAVIAEHWYRYVDSGQIAIVRAWLARLGAAQISADPVAAHCAAWVAVLSGERGAFTRWLAVIEAAEPDEEAGGPLPDGMRSLEFSAALLRGTFGFGGIGPMAESAARAIELEPNPESHWGSLARVASGTAQYLSGEISAARQTLEQALSHEVPPGRMLLLALSIRCLVAVEEGQADQAARFAQAAHEIETDLIFGLSAMPQGAFAPLALGAVHASEGRLEEAKEELTRALACRRRRPGVSPWPKLEMLLRLAPVLQDLDDLPGAAALLAEARDVLAFFPQGAQAQLGRLAGLERRLGGYGRSPAAEQLTSREQAVLRWLEGTLSLSEIGKEMYVSANTVKTHTRAIYRKLGVSSRRDAVERGRERGLL